MIRRPDGVPVFRASYCLTDDGGWAITVDTDRGPRRTTAARLCDVERRAYEVVRTQAELEVAAFDVDFVHQLDLVVDESLTS